MTCLVVPSFVVAGRLARLPLLVLFALVTFTLTSRSYRVARLDASRPALVQPEQHSPSAAALLPVPFFVLTAPFGGNLP